MIGVWIKRSIFGASHKVLDLPPRLFGRSGEVIQNRILYIRCLYLFLLTWYMK